MAFKYLRKIYVPYARYPRLSMPIYNDTTSNPESKMHAYQQSNQPDQPTHKRKLMLKVAQN